MNKAWISMVLVGAVMICAGTSATGLDAAAAPKGFTYDAWESWNAFAEGSSVTLETTSDFGGNKSVMKTTTTLKKKEAEKITVTDEMEVAGNKMPGTDRVIEKPKGAPAAGDCPACKKPAKDHKAPEVKESEAKAKVGDQELTVAQIASTVFDCSGKETMTTVAQYSKDVPGWIVRMEAKMAQGSTTQVATGFTKK